MEINKEELSLISHKPSIIGDHQQKASIIGEFSSWIKSKSTVKPKKEAVKHLKLQQDLRIDVQIQQQIINLQQNQQQVNCVEKIYEWEYDIPQQDEMPTLQNKKIQVDRLM